MVAQAEDDAPSTPPLTVGVIVPTHSGSEWLPRCLASLLAQDLTEPFEVVVVQYGPEDGTRAAVAAASARRPDLTIRHLTAEVETRSAAKNVGIRASTASRLVFVHDEDRVAPGFLRGLVGVPPTSNRLVVPVRVVDRGERPANLQSAAVRRQLSQAGRVVQPHHLGSALGHPTGLLLPRDLIAGLQFDDDLDVGEDAVLLGRLLARGGLECAVPDAGAGSVYYRAAGPCSDSSRLDARRLLVGAQRLAALPPGDALGAARSALVDSVVAEVNRYLRTRPDDHAVVIDQRRRRGLEEVVELRTLNDRVARDLAVLYTAAPFVDTSANVAARRVLRRRRIVDVITNDMSSRLASDPLSEAIWAEFLDRQVVLHAHPSDMWWPGVTEFCRLGLAQIAALESTKGPYRTVYSRAMHPTSHFLAAWHKLRNPEVRWLAEFSDPVRRDVKGQERPSTGQPDPVMMTDFRAGLAARNIAAPESDSLFRWLETITYAFADEITFTNGHQLGFMLGHFPDRRLAARAAERSVVSHHPRPEPRLYRLADSGYQLPQDKINLAYFGVFYATRGLSEVWQALQRLPVSIRGSVMLHVFTSKPEELVVELAAAGLDDVVRANSYLSYPEYLNLAARADVLIVNDARTAGIHDRNPYLPSKWSDYAGSGSAVWGIVEPSSVLSGQPLQHRSELGDVDGAERVLTQIVRDRVPRLRLAERGQPAVSVVVATHDRPDVLPRALRSLGSQTLAGDRYEVLVVANGPRDHVPQIIETVRAEFPDARFRSQQVPIASAARARNLGFDEARGQYVTVVDDDDWVSPSYLDGLLQHTGPDVLPLAWLADVRSEAPEPDFDNYYTRALSRVSGQVVPVLAVHQGISVNVCKLVPTEVARAVRYDENLRSGEDFVFWARVFARRSFRWSVVADRGVVYYRALSENSLSRQTPSFDFNVVQRLDAITALDTIPPAPGDLEELLRRLTSGQLAFIRRFLALHPEHLSAVEAEFRTRALGRLSPTVFTAAIATATPEARDSDPSRPAGTAA